MRARRRRFALIAALLCGSAVAAPSPQQLATQVHQLRERAGVAASAVVLVERERVLLVQARGLRDWSTRQPVDEETRFRVGSLSKLFTALALLRAEAQGLLALDAPLRAALPQAPYDNPFEATHPLTLAMLLEHTAGWPDLSPQEFDSTDPAPLTLAQALALQPASRRSRWPPGTAHEYSNSGAGLAGWALEQLTRQRFEDYAAAQVLAPLGMKSASFTADATTLSHLAQGYDRDHRSPLPYWHILYRPAGGLNLAPRDMAPLLQMLLNRGRAGDAAFITPAQVARMEQAHTTLAAQAGLEPGYGLGIRLSLHRGQRVYGHGGDADGYLSHFGYSPASGRGYFVVITAFDGDTLDAMQALLDDWLVDGLPALAAPAIGPLDAANAKALAGDYERATQRFEAAGPRERLRIEWTQGALRLMPPGADPQTLLPVRGALFRRPGDPIATLALLPQADGAVLLQGAYGNWRKPPR